VEVVDPALRVARSRRRAILSIFVILVLLAGAGAFLHWKDGRSQRSTISDAPHEVSQQQDADLAVPPQAQETLQPAAPDPTATPDPTRTLADGIGKQPADGSDPPAARDDGGPAGRTLADGIGKQPARGSGGPVPREDDGPAGRPLADGIGKQPAEGSDPPAARDDDGPGGRTLADGIGKQPTDHVEPQRSAPEAPRRSREDLRNLPQTAARTVDAPPPGGTAAPPPAGAGAAAGPAPIGATAPSFDVVRVDQGGDVVAAGRAEPNARVTLSLDGRAIGETRADARGQWVYLTDRPLATVEGELSVAAVDAAGRSVTARDVVVVARTASGDRTTADPKQLQPGAAEQRQLPQQQATASPSGSQTVAGEAATPRQAAPEERSAAPAPLAVLVPQEGAPVVLQGPQTGITIGDFSLDSLTYDANGRVTVGGHLGDGGRAFVYVDDGFVGEATPDTAGRWSLSGQEPVAYGLHRLRIDQVDARGAVLARIETPFVRSERLPDLSQAERFVIVQPGSNLWTIARRTYGGGLQYVVIFNANTDQIKAPDLIYPGQIFALPNRG